MTTYLLNSGHGVDTKGKRSPFIPPGILEYEFNIAIAEKIIKLADEVGVDCIHLDPEVRQVRLSEIVRRANKHYEDNKDSIFVSLHANAMGNGKRWNDKAKGSAVFVAHTASRTSRAFANILAPKIAIAGYFQNRGVKEGGLYVLKHTKGPAVLAESGFMTHPSDATKLASDYWRDKIAHAMVDAMVQWNRSKNYA
jgi:N-acetylmuramoyl-L-alanine amidase